MNLAHLSDLHLGRRQYDRLNKAGVNQREADTALAFRRAVDAIEGEKPDLILVAGDVFHVVNPTNTARLEAFTQFRRLAAVAPTLVIAGNHETPKSVESGTPVRLLAEIPGLIEATQEQVQWVSPDGSVGVCLMPHAAVYRGEAPKRPGTPIEILLIHGAVPGIHQPGDLRDGIAATFEPTDGCWSYVALGDYHVCRQVAANAWYCGSVEYVSSNPWGELKDEAAHGVTKGWLLVTVGPGQPATVSFQPVVTRPHVDYPAIDATGLSVAEVLARIPSPEPGVVARQVVTELNRHDRRAILSSEHIRSSQIRALHFNVDCRLAKRVAQVVDAPIVREDREPWEIEQDRAAAYWDGREPQDAGPLPDLASFDPNCDPYAVARKPA